MTERLEEIAYHFVDGILWLAYRQSGPEKEEIVYTQGIHFEEETSGSLYATLGQILKQDFVPRNGSLADLFPRFLGCDRVYLDTSTPEGIKAVMQGFFSGIDLECREVLAPLQTFGEINARWSGPLGEALQESELPGSIRVLSVLEAGTAKALPQTTHKD